MEKIHGRTLEYWKNNAEEDYLKVPISVLKYITCLEERLNQLTISNVKNSDTIHECNKCMFDKDLGFCPKCDTDCHS